VQCRRLAHLERKFFVCHNDEVRAADGEGDEGEEDLECVTLGDELDLHTFAPKDVHRLVPDYIDDCIERGFEQVRIIHGKGKGVQRRIVHSALEKHAGVKKFYLAEAVAGGWGATIVELRVPGE
jgi:dsDNA-specific endonuclease/ATPase MutS2